MTKKYENYEVDSISKKHDEFLNGAKRISTIIKTSKKWYSILIILSFVVSIVIPLSLMIPLRYNYHEYIVNFSPNEHMFYFLLSYLFLYVIHVSIFTLLKTLLYYKRNYKTVLHLILLKPEIFRALNSNNDLDDKNFEKSKLSVTYQYIKKYKIASPILIEGYTYLIFGNALYTLIPFIKPIPNKVTHIKIRDGKIIDVNISNKFIRKFDSDIETKILENNLKEIFIFMYEELNIAPEYGLIREFVRGDFEYIIKHKFKENQRVILNQA